MVQTGNKIEGVDTMGKRSELSAAERREVVLMMLRREEPISVLARRYGISETTLHHWRNDFLQAGQVALSHGKSKKAKAETERIRQLERDLAKRDQVIGELTIANRILKKTRTAFCRR
jgi:transposase-like protein